VQPDDHPANPPPSGPSGGIALDRLGGHAVVPPGLVSAPSPAGRQRRGRRHLSRGIRQLTDRWATAVQLVTGDAHRRLVDAIR
jgi:hypothetical protein